MKQFRFALESVLKYRQLQFDVQRARIEELYAALQSVEAQATQLQDEVSREGRTVKLQGVVEPLELLALDAFSRSAEQQQSRFASRKTELLSSIDQERGKLLGTQRNRDLLDKLKDRQHTAWKAAEAAELEALAHEAFLSRWRSSEISQEGDVT